jgi:hypothetical protein
VLLTKIGRLNVNNSHLPATEEKELLGTRDQRVELTEEEQNIPK